MEEKSFFLQAGGHRLRALSLTPEPGRAGPTLVLLHDALGSIGQWRDFPRALVAATDLPLLVYERCGHGGSDPLPGRRPFDYLEEEAGRVLPEVLAACAIDRPILVGHSDGATIALLYAAAFPEGARGVISEAGHVLVEKETLRGVRAAVAEYRQGDLPERLARYHGEGTAALFAAWSETWLHPDFRDWNITARLPALRVPLLALQGADDEYATRGQLETIAAGVSGPARAWLVPACRHVPHHQARTAVLAEMARFIAEVAGHD